MHSDRQPQDTFPPPGGERVDDDDPLVAQMADQRLLRLLLENSPTVLPAGLVVATIIHIALQKAGGSDWSLVWLVGLVFISATRFLLNRWSKRRLAPEQLQQTVIVTAAAAFLGGAGWAVLVFFGGPETPFGTRLLVVITLVGMPVAGLSSMAFCKVAYFAFAMPIFVAIIAWAWWFNPGLSVEFTLIATAHIALVSVMAHRYHENARRSIQREIENQQLLHEVNLMNSELQRLAFEDPLTGLSNRRRFEETAGQLLQRLRPGDRLALMLIDVDGFKWVNDTLGHAAGDRLLVELSQRIDQNSRLNEIVVHTQIDAARIGGDEFIVIYRLAVNADAELLAARILAALTAPMRFGGQEYRPSVSIGVALAPTQANRLDDLLRLADSAMYQAKIAGGSRFTLAHPAPDDAAGRMPANTPASAGGQ